MHPQGKYNALLPPPFSSFSLSHFFSALAIFERDKGRICREAKLDKTLHPLHYRPLYHRHHHRNRRLAELSECYKRVRERAIRQRCNTVLRTPLSSRRISYFVDFVSSIRSKSEKKIQGEPCLLFNIFLLAILPVINVQSFSFCLLVSFLEALELI